MTSQARGATDRPDSAVPKPRRVDVWRRFLISLGVGAAASALVPSGVHPNVRVLLAWDVAVVLFMGLLWPLLHHGHPARDASTSRRLSQKTFIALVIAMLASLVATGVMLTDLHAVPDPQRSVQVALSVLAVVGTWLLTNVVFALRYAQLYYRQREDDPTAVPSVDFQGGDSPGYSDFLYLAFAIGMTFGVTDTGLGSTRMRRIVLAHSVLSFWFNTVILALALNLVSALL